MIKKLTLQSISHLHIFAYVDLVTPELYDATKALLCTWPTIPCIYFIQCTIRHRPLWNFACRFRFRKVSKLTNSCYNRIEIKVNSCWQNGFPANIGTNSWGFSIFDKTSYMKTLWVFGSAIGNLNHIILTISATGTLDKFQTNKTILNYHDDNIILSVFKRPAIFQMYFWYTKNFWILVLNKIIWCIVYPVRHRKWNIPCHIMSVIYLFPLNSIRYFLLKRQFGVIATYDT